MSEFLRRTISITFITAAFALTAFAATPPSLPSSIMEVNDPASALVPWENDVASAERLPIADGTATTPAAPELDDDIDTEQTIIAQRIGTTDHVITAWMTWTPGAPANRPQIQIRVAASPNMTTWTRRTLSVYGNGVAGDPLLAENPFTIGLAPKRIYLAGTSYEWVGDDGERGANQISVWWSDDGGQTWSPTPAALSPNNGAWFTDKSSIAVSWAPSTRGHVYVAHMYLDRTTQCSNSNGASVACPPQIHVHRSNQLSSPGAAPTFQRTAVIDNLPATTQSPMILTDSNSGHVFLVWLQWNTNTITVARSTDQGQTFTVLATTNAGPFFFNNRYVRHSSGTRLLAVSVLMARYNALSGTIGIVWHARNSNQDGDVKFIEFDPSTSTFGTRRTVTDQTPQNPDAMTAGDQWNPALDYDDHGNYLVTYYDTRGSTDRFTYRVKAAKLAPNGSRLLMKDTVVTPQSSDVTGYDPNQLGEYQDVWYWFGKWYTGFLQLRPGANHPFSDAYVSRIGFRHQTPSDFDGNGVSELVLYKGGAWQNFSGGPGVWTGQPSPNCIPAPGDYDGNGTTDRAQLCNGGWHFYNADGSYLKGIWIGGSSDVPVPAVQTGHIGDKTDREHG